MPKLRLKAKYAFTAWAVVVYTFLFLPILVMAVFAFNKPSPAALAGFHGSNICSIPPAQVGNITVWNGFSRKAAFGRAPWSVAASIRDQSMRSSEANTGRMNSGR